MKQAILIILMALSLAACAAANDDHAARTVEQYLQAKVESNEGEITRLICSEMERDIPREVASFNSVEAELIDLTCESLEDANLVRCTGQIEASYGNELREFPLSTYRVIEEDGEWRWCGEGS